MNQDLSNTNNIIYIHLLDSNIIPTELFIIPQQHQSEAINFTMTWPSPKGFDVHYNITISPQPLHGPVVVNSSSVIIQVVNWMMYNITLSSSLCSVRRRAHFTFGKCQ